MPVLAWSGQLGIDIMGVTDALRELSWSGIPASARATTWQLLSVWDTELAHKEGVKKMKGCERLR